jgi:hypothetical protein
VGWWFEPTTFSQEAPADVKTEIPLATMTYVLRQRHSDGLLCQEVAGKYRFVEEHL